MDPAILQTLVQQAAQAEARLAQIESKLSGTWFARHGATSAVRCGPHPTSRHLLRFFDIPANGSLPPSTVADLQELKALLLQAKADNEQLKAERDQALKAATAAEKEASKFNYRILHLKRAVQEAKAKGAAAPSS
eukprot:gene6409-6640_t